MNKMHITLTRFGVPDKVFEDVHSVKVTVVDGTESKRYRVKPRGLAIRIILDGLVTLRPVATNLVEIECTED